MCKVTLGVLPVSLLSLPTMHVLVVTHLFGCVEMEIVCSFIPFLTRRKTEPGARIYRALKPLISHLRYVRVPSNTNTSPALKPLVSHLRYVRIPSNTNTIPIPVPR